MILLDLRIRVAADRRAAFMTFLHEAVPYYESPGGIRIRLLENAADPTRMIERVEYATRAAYELDQRRVAEDPSMKSLLVRWRALLAEPPVVETWVVTDLD